MATKTKVSNGTAARNAKAEKKVIPAILKNVAKKVEKVEIPTVTPTAKVTAPKAVKAELTPAELQAKKDAKLLRTQEKAFALGRRVYFTRWDKEKNEMRCLKCGETWTPVRSTINPDRLVRGSWPCPKGCCVLPPEKIAEQEKKAAEKKAAEKKVEAKKVSEKVEKK